MRRLSAARGILAASLAIVAGGLIQGGADAFAAALPIVGAVSPTAGPTAGGTSVTVTGSNLSGTTTVTFAGVAATAVTNVSSTQVSAKSPAGAAGIVDVQVRTAAGESVPAAQDLFSYDAAPAVLGVTPSNGPTSGGTSVTIYGQGFVAGATTVSIGGASASSVTVDSASKLTATTPSGTAGSAAAAVTVTTPGGPSAATVAGQFTYGSAIPSNLQVNEVGLTEAAITWSAPAIPGVIGYTVLRNGVALAPVAGQANNGQSNSPATTLDGLTTNYLDTGLTANTTYHYTVEALTSTGFTAPSSALPVTTAFADTPP